MKWLVEWERKLYGYDSRVFSVKETAEYFMSTLHKSKNATITEMTDQEAKRYELGMKGDSNGIGK